MTSQSDENRDVEIDLSVYKELFLEESQQHLAALRENLARLEDDPIDNQALREARRAAHTLKGMAYTMHYEDLGALGRMLESQIESQSPPTTDRIKALMADCDEFEMGLARLSEGTGDDQS